MEQHIPIKGNFHQGYIKNISVIRLGKWMVYIKTGEWIFARFMLIGLLDFFYLQWEFRHIFAAICCD